MQLIMEIPDDLANEMHAAGGDLSRRALEALSIEEYKANHLTEAQLRRLFGIQHSVRA